MKVALLTDFKNVNCDYMRPIFKRGIASLAWQETNVENADFCILWGVKYHWQTLVNKKKKMLIADFPYWNRGGKNRNGAEYYKISVNSQHPTKYILEEKHTPDRYLATNGLPIMPWKKTGDYILVAGMGVKAAMQNGHNIQGWEREAVRQLKQYTNLPIVYRPKPTIHPMPQIIGTTFDDGSRSIDEALSGAKALVCHHGNPTVTALAAGVPIFMNGFIGAASHFAEFDLSKINEPKFPDGREQFLYNLAHWQWSVEEIRSGEALLSYQKRGFI
jgi:hypothetical protein